MTLDEKDKIETPETAPETEATDTCAAPGPAADPGCGCDCAGACADCAAPPEEPDPVAVLAGALEASEKERVLFKDQLLRARAEFDNYRKRVARDAEQLRRTAAQDLLRDLLAVADNLERALEHADASADGGVAEGVRMVLRQMQDLMASRGVAAIPARGEAFDPNLHEALAMQPSDDCPAGTVLVEFQKGYTLDGAVLRPAKVVVSSGPAEAAEAPPAGPESAETQETNN